MTDHTDIVERLEKDKWHITAVDAEDAIAEITRLRAEVEALRTAMSCAADLIAESMMHDAQTGTLLAKAHNLLAGTQAIDATKGTT